MRSALFIAASAAVLIAAPAVAGPRETLTQAAFQAATKAQALDAVNGALAQTTAMLAAAPGDHEAALQHALAVGYRGKLTRKPADAKQARREFEAVATATPRDPEVLMALAGWHLEAVADVGGFLAGSILGAKQATGLATLDRAVALGGDRALFAGYASLIRIRVDAGDVARATALAQRAIAAPAPTALDRIFQQDAAKLLPVLKSGDGKAASALAKQLLPFGRVI